MTLEGEEVEEEAEEPEGEGTGSTELSDIRLLGRCERRKKNNSWDEKTDWEMQDKRCEGAREQNHQTWLKMFHYVSLATRF